MIYAYDYQYTLSSVLLAVASFLEAVMSTFLTVELALLTPETVLSSEAVT